MTFLEHLEELRWTIVRSLVAIGIAAVLLFVVKDFIFDNVVLAPMYASFWTYSALCSLSHLMQLGETICLEADTFELQNISMAGQFMTHLKVSFIGGIIAAFPFVLWEIWKFISPGLHGTERKGLRWVVFSASILFFCGVLFGYYLICPLSIQFLGTYQVSAEVPNMITLDSFISLVTSITLATGLLFQLPLVVLFLTRAGLVTPAFLRAYRKHSIVIILLVSAIITPPDLTSQVLVTLPLMILYEISIFLSERTVRRMNLNSDIPRAS